jgi:hypothetical protein
MCADGIARRDFIRLATAGVAGGVLGLRAALAANSPAEPWDPKRPLHVPGEKLKVQPVFMHTTFQRREKTSWKSWSDINTKDAAAEEAARIARELKELAAKADFPLELLPLATVTTVEEAKKVHESDYDAVLLFPATGGGGTLRACFPPKPEKDAIVFVRHESGPTYYWYEALSTGYLKKSSDFEQAKTSARDHGGLTVHDAVVDDYAEVAWRLRALCGLRNFIGQRIVALGGAGGKYDSNAPKAAREKFELNIIEVTYDQLRERIRKAKADAPLVAQAAKWTRQYLALPRTRLQTQEPFVTNAFILYRVFKDWLREHEAWAFTIGACMGTVMPIAETTACMPLSWLNDEGYAAFCESDFVIIPPGMLLHAIARRPVFLCNSTFPHKGVVTVAHCTAPRRMDGTRYEPARILTHYESDYGAAPKVDMRIGQEVTFIDPEYASGRWLGFKGVIKANPFHAICRTQQDIELQGDWRRLLDEARDSHWMMAYGDHLRELAYAARKIGIKWVNLAGPLAS